MNLPITLALMTTTKGHFQIKTRWLETVKSLKANMLLENYDSLLAHIKVSPGEEDYAEIMSDKLKYYGFIVVKTTGDWSHGQESHQIQYIQDLLKITNLVKTPYIKIFEDDWLLKTSNHSFYYWCSKAIDLLENNPDLMQVRIPRYSNEFERINKLKQKHGLNRSAVQVDEYHFRHDDYSANPSFYRTRDIRNAVALTLRTNTPKHVEHGVGEILRLLGEPGKQFACLNPEEIRIGHIGCRPGEEDDLTKPLNCD
jgi:hypothetical protein